VPIQAGVITGAIVGVVLGLLVLVVVIYYLMRFLVARRVFSLSVRSVPCSWAAAGAPPRHRHLRGQDVERSVSMAMRGRDDPPPPL